jgi:hypothetical protein
MVALMIGLVPMMIRLRMTRIGGAVLLFVYAAFIVSQIVTAMSSS